MFNFNLSNPGKYKGNELKYLKKVLKSENLSSLSGSWVGRLENNFCKTIDSKFAIAMNSGTSTLHSILESLNLPEGGEVLIPALSVIMDSTVCFLSDLVPIYVDIDPNTFLMDPIDLRKKITRNSVAIITVSLYGNVPSMDQISEIAKENNIFLIEDNAQAIFASTGNKKVGDWGIASSWSFENTKHISCGEGGMVTTNKKDLAESIRKIGGHGFKNLRAEEGRVRLVDDIFQDPEYERHDILGWNYRMSEISAAVALAQLERAKELVAMRKYNAKKLIEAIDSHKILIPQLIPENTSCDYYTFSCLYNQEYSKGISWQEFRKLFKAKTGMGIYGAWQVQYKEPMIYNGAFKYRNKKLYDGLDYKNTKCDNAEKVQRKIMQFKTNIRSKRLTDDIANKLNEIIKEVGI